MRHNLSMEGYAFRLRPITDQDAAFVVELRSNPDLNRYLHASSNRVEDQRAWLVRYYEAEDSYYFVVERSVNGMPEGVIALYDIDFSTNSGEWGRWILKPNSLAAVESAYLIYRTAFELLGLNSVYCRTVADNQKVVSFHDSCGVTTRRALPQYFELGGHRHDAVEHRLDVAGWPAVKKRLEQLARLTARGVNRG
jgi:RimJ/RimL family protein N-acetyltransferase